MATTRPPLRVGMVCPYSLSVPGGVQAQVMGLARQLRAMGIEVRVLAPCDGPPPDTFVTPLGNSLPTSANGSVAPLAPDPSAALRTIRALIEEQFDVLHLHEPLVPGPTMTALLVRPAPIVATFHAAGESASYRYFNPLVTTWARQINQSVVVSRDALALVQRHGLGETAEILFNGVELEHYASGPRWPTDGKRTIFFCGRHEERKGLDVLLDAMVGLGPDVQLWVGSSGPESERLRARTAGDGRIQWLGQLSDADKIARLRGADVFCAPSLRGESFGVVLVEAMAAGTPIVASALDGYRNVATDDVDALLIEPGDAGALAVALKRVLHEPELAARLRTAGLRRSADFSMNALAQHYAAHYARLAQAAGRSAEHPQVPRWRRGLRRMMTR